MRHGRHSRTSGEATVGLAAALPESALYESVNDEWSFVQTLRHLVFAIDKWFTAPVLGEPFDPIGLPNSGSVDFPWPGLDGTLTPSYEDAMAVRDGRAASVRGYLESVTMADLERDVDVLENGTNPVTECFYHRVRGRVLAHPLRPARSRDSAGRRPLNPPATRAGGSSFAASGCSSGRVYAPPRG